VLAEHKVTNSRQCLPHQGSAAANKQAATRRTWLGLGGDRCLFKKLTSPYHKAYDTIGALSFPIPEAL